MATQIDLPYGNSVLSFETPAGWRVRHAPRLPAGPGPALEAAIEAALAGPVDGPRLRDLARPGMTVAVAVTDATRPCPDHLFLPALVAELEAGGVDRRDITVVVALGMHRHCTAAERAEILGPLGQTLRLEEAQGAERDRYADLGTLDAGAPALPAPVPMRVHRRIVESDLVVATGIVEPHQYAGFSGGRKTVGIGCAGAETIGVLHGISYLEASGTRLGQLEGNPVHIAVTEIAQRAGLSFALNVALDADRQLVGVAAGKPEAVLQDLVRRLAPHTRAPVGPDPFDLVLAGVGAPKDANFYQASRALTYLAFSPRPVLKPGAWILLAARCEEGAGTGPGEREFLARMAEGDGPEEVVAALRNRGFGAGGQRAFMLARALGRYRGMVVGAMRPDEVSACGVETVADPEDAVARLAEALPADARVLALPHGLATLPIPEDP